MAVKLSSKLQLEIAIKLYARARGISIDDARDNVRDAAFIQLDAERKQGKGPADNRN